MAAPTASNIIYLWLIRFVGAAYIINPKKMIKDYSNKNLFGVHTRKRKKSKTIK